MSTKKIKLVIEADLANVEIIGMTVNAFCRGLRLPEPTPHEMELCVVEAANNCIVHAYAHQTGGEIEVIIELAGERLTFKVCDTGETMIPMLYGVNRPEFDPGDISTLPENGMGLFIIHEIMDDVAYERSAGMNILTMSKRFSTPLAGRGRAGLHKRM